jgi:excisionase family DNA binding protein
MTKTPAEKENQDKPLMSIAEGSKFTTLSKRTLGRMCARGDIRAVKVGRRWLISRESLMALLEPAL